jgi:hypothetical protein
MSLGKNFFTKIFYFRRLRFYNSQNDENLLNGIINKQLDRKQLKRKWNTVYGYHGPSNGKFYSFGWLNYSRVYLIIGCQT